MHADIYTHTSNMFYQSFGLVLLMRADSWLVIHAPPLSRGLTCRQDAAHKDTINTGVCKGMCVDICVYICIYVCINIYACICMYI